MFFDRQCREKVDCKEEKERSGAKQQLYTIEIVVIEMYSVC